MPNATASAPAELRPNRDLSLLAPKFRTALLLGLHDAWLSGFDPVVYEAFRSSALQAYYYAQGRTRPGEIITYAKDAVHGWHFFGLAADVISRGRGWDYSGAWLEHVPALFKARGLAWGGDWRMRDLPHFQWADMPDSPTDDIRDVYHVAAEEHGDPYDGRLAVWKAVRAI